MKNYSRAALTVVAGSCLGLVTTTLNREMFGYFGLPSERPFHLGHLRGLVAHPFAPLDLFAWAWAALLILLASRLMLREVGEWSQALLAVTGALVGGICFVLFQPDGHLFVGPAFIAWSFTGGGVAYGIMKWSTLVWPWRIYTIIFMVGLANGAFIWDAVYVAQSISAASGALLVLTWQWQKERQEVTRRAKLRRRATESEIRELSPRPPPT